MFLNLAEESNNRGGGGGPNIDGWEGFILRTIGFGPWAKAFA